MAEIYYIDEYRPRPRLEYKFDPLELGTIMLQSLEDVVRPKAKLEIVQQDEA